MASQRIKNTLSFADLAIGASVVLPHGLMTSNFRPLAPDIVFIPSPGLDVVTDAINVTLTNMGPVPLSGSVLVEAWHTIERTFDGIQNEDLPIKPYIVVGAESGNAPPQPPFKETQITIYARTTGNDTSGNGTFAKPYRTLQRAVRDIPSFVPPNVIYFVDITGIQEALPPNYTLPEWKSAFITNFIFSVADPGPYVDYFLRILPVNILAIPERASLPPGEAELSVADFTISNDPRTGMATFTLTGPPRASWAANALRGKLLHGVSGPFDNAFIWESDTTFLRITNDGSGTAPFRIEQPSATLSCADTGAAFTTIQSLNNEAVAFGGIKFDGGGVVNGLDVEGYGNLTVQLCDMENPYIAPVIAGQVPGRVLRNYIHGDFSFFAPVWLFFNENIYFGGPDDTKFAGSPQQLSIFSSVFDGGHSIIPSNIQDGFFPASVGSMVLAGCVIRNSIDSGVALGGGYMRVENCDIYANAFDGITVFGPSLTNVINCGSSGAANGQNGVGVYNGAQLSVDAATSGAADPLTGTSGDTNVGSVGVVPWATIAAPPNNVPDFAGPAATGARLFQE